MGIIPPTEWWYWAALGLLCAVLEIFIPTGFLIGLGIAAFLMALIVFLMPLMLALSLSWEIELFVYALLSLLSVFIMRRWFLAKPIVSDHPLLNQRGCQYIGRRFTLEMPIVNGQGKLRVDDSTWKVRGVDCAAGATVIVNGVDGVVFDVKIVDPANNDSSTPATTAVD